MIGYYIKGTMKQEIIELLHSMNEEDIKFGLALAKETNLFHEIKQDLTSTALPISRWTDKYCEDRNKKWCISSMHNLIYRCTEFGSPYTKVIYFE